MVTQVLIDYLKDENVDIKKKKLYLERLNLQYSDIFKLKEIFNYDRNLFHCHDTGGNFKRSFFF